MKVLIFGFGAHGGGFSATKYYLDHGHEVRITDMRNRAQLGERLNYFEKLGVKTTLGGHKKSDFLWADIVIKNPAVKSDNKYLNLAKKVATDFSIFFTSPIINDIKIIAITGTKGKTTTAAVVNYVLNNSGHKSMLCGNMGISAFTVLEELEKSKEKPEFIVCELSSWQISDAYYLVNGSVNIEIAIITNIMEDHLNYYKTLEDYLEDKLLMLKFNCNFLISANDLRPVISKYLNIPKSKVISIENSSRKVIDLSQIYKPAYSICHTLKIRKNVILDNIKKFPGIPHRNEFVRFVGNTIFINDSAATIPMAVNFCITNNHPGFSYYIICGGTDKNLSPEPMLSGLKDSQGIILLDGSFTRHKLIPMLKENNIKFKGPYKTMDAAVKACWNLAKAHIHETRNQIIFLSPGASSFEFFTNEYDRGNKYKIAVKAIPDDEKCSDI